jgi:hypothetical protein
VRDLRIGENDIDPTKAKVKSQLLSKLGLSSSLQVARFGVTQAGQLIANGFNNAGLWTISDAGGVLPELMVKLVSSDLGESTKFQKLAAEFPEIGSDQLLAFPLHIVRCITGMNIQSHELIVMQRAAGVCLHEFVQKKLREDPGGMFFFLMPLFEQVGVALAEFHSRYGNKQHSDFQPANIIYNETTQKMTFVDMANMGSPLNPPGSDVTQFRAAIRALYGHLSCPLSATFEQQFVSGYSRVLSSQLDWH